jgi:arylsulfatase A-like enzyme
MSTQKPNVVFIVLDTHRVDRLGCYGYERDTSPNLDAFAQDSTVYEKAISPAQWTIPAHASMFSGEYPATHNTIQASDALSDSFLTLAEYVQRAGYRTVGFCNNPLVGVLNNGFRRGFQEFYNYGGTIPSTPSSNGHNSKTLFSKIRGQYFKLIDRIATPIQQAVAASPEVLQIALNPLLVPLWTRYSNFKGDTGASIRDTTDFLRRTGDQPQFIFLNLMGTHLPYAPPRLFIQKFAPIVLDDPDAGEFMSVYNTQALRWLLPLDKPYPVIQAKALRDMYDAEVAYQDRLLNQLLSKLDQPEHRENTLVIIVGDHGEMLGEHQIMGHGLGVHEELVHVPMMIRFPGQTRSVRIKQAVSTIRVFHTVLEAIGIESIKMPHGKIIATSDTSLSNTAAIPKYVFSEAYPPNHLIIIMEKYAPDLIERFHCRTARWAVYNQPYKLVRTDNVRDEIYHYENDPGEMKNLDPEAISLPGLSAELERFLTSAADKGYEHTRGSTTNLDDELVMQRLRNLGYIE